MAPPVCCQPLHTPPRQPCLFLRPMGYCDVRFLREQQASIAQQFGVKKRSSIGGNRHNDGLAFVCASIAQQTGDRRCNQLKPYVIEQRRERNLLRDRADLDLLKSFSGQQSSDLVRLRKNVLGALDARCRPSKAPNSAGTAPVQCLRAASAHGPAWHTRRPFFLYP